MVRSALNAIGECGHRPAHDGKFEAICALIADELGLGELHTLGEPDRALVKAEADEATERWMEHADMATPPKTSLQKLLAEHFELVGQILDMQESEEGDD
jgi:hypothetical protein